MSSNKAPPKPQTKKKQTSICRQVFRIWFIVVFLLACGIAYLTEPHGMQLKTVHVNNSPADLQEIKEDAQAKSIGWTTQQPNNYFSNNPLSRLTGKRWDSYVFVAFNYHIVEVTLADLTYASQITITYTSFKHTDQIIVEKLVSFSLSDSFWTDNITINSGGLNFNLTRLDTPTELVTWIQFKTMSGNKTLTGNLTHFMNKTQCMYFQRPFTSVKCLHGKSEGFVRNTWSHYNKEYRLEQNHDDVWVMSKEIATTMYDGFRGQGLEWYWVWAMGIGWTENIERGHPIKQDRIRTVALSMGVMYGFEEDFLLVEGQLVKLHGVNYTLDETKPWQLLRFTQIQVLCRSESPKGWFEFNVTGNHHYRENLIVIQKDMRKAYGIWKGEVELEDGKLEFNKVFGLVEVSKSRF